MSTFTCEVVKVRVENHPNADAIDIAHVGLYQSIIKKGQFKTGDLAVYIPEGSVLPQPILEDLLFWDQDKSIGMLSGSRGDRVKPMRLRGVVSQGLLYPIADKGLSGPVEGTDLAEHLGITKYIPRVPESMRGIVAGVIYGLPHWDIENLKKFPEELQPGMYIRVTEKIHGTFCAIGAMQPGTHDISPKSLHNGCCWVTSKGFYQKGNVFNPNTDPSTYTRICKEMGVFDVVEQKMKDYNTSVILFGEIYGAGIQDMQYGTVKPSFRQFGELHLVGSRWEEEQTSYMGIPSVDVLYQGEYESLEWLKGLAEEDSSVSLTPKSVREGLVIEIFPQENNPDSFTKRLKLISNRYLFRKGATTEYE